MSAIDRRLGHGEIIQIIDPEHLTQEQVLALAGGQRPILRVPRPLVFVLGKLSELPLGRSAARARSPPILRSALARLRYESDLARSLLGWQPRVGVREGIRRMM